MGDHWNGQGKDEVVNRSDQDVRGRAEHEDIDEFDEETEDQDDEDIDDLDDVTY